MPGTPHCHPSVADRSGTPDKHSGANPETQVGMELSYNRGHFGGRGSTQYLPSSGLDGAVEECV